MTITKRKLVTIKTRRQWEPVLAACIQGLLSEPARTNGAGQRAKIRLKFHKDYVPFIKFPKFVWVECDEENYCIREWRCCTLIDWLFKYGISQWNTSMIYKRRSGLLQSMTALHKLLDNCLLEDYDDVSQV